ncbi:MAG: hypothetical protein ACRC8N_14070 [Aeromonas veronii]|uniref:hypothetical protein n=1 Tax=Aeromonas veronii TaxID=654 RepID=UPI003D255201
MQSLRTEILSSIKAIARVTPDLTIDEREGMCRAIITLAEVGERLEEQRKPARE